MIQATLDFARTSRDAGMSQALSHAERYVASWGDLAFEFLQKFARERTQFTSFELRTFAKQCNFESPTTDKAWGAIFVKAARAGIIKKIGYSPHPERHASPTVVWQVSTAPAGPYPDRAQTSLAPPVAVEP